MADRKPTSHYYGNLGGVNQKTSEYTLDKTQFLDLRNMDFDVPNALQKREGATQAVGVNTSGPILSLFEFQRLNGASWVVAGSDTALFYLASNAYTLLDAGWNNGQPQDMLTFVNRLWVADGGRFKSWDGGASWGVQQVGMHCASRVLNQPSNVGTATMWLVGGATMFAQAANASWVARGVYVAYSYVRNDGYIGPADFLASARNVVSNAQTTAEGAEFFAAAEYPNVQGFSITPTGVTAVAIWIAVDSVAVGAATEPIDGVGTPRVGHLGWEETNLGRRYMSATLKPTADLSRFYLYTLVAGASLVNNGSFFQATFSPVSFNSYTGPNPVQPTIMPFCWFNTNVPKYIDVNQNVMFMSGFSATPSTVWFSDIGLPESIQPEYFFEVRTNDGDRVIGHRTYNGSTIVFKETSFHKVLGTTPADFELIELSLEFGAVSNQAIIEYNEKLLWLDRKGIVQYDGAGWRIISDGIDEVFRRMNLSAAVEKACAVHHHYRNQIWFGIPVDGSTRNNLTVVYDYLVDAWTFFDGFNASSFGYVTGALSKDTVWRGNYSGMIYYHSASFYGDNGVGISCVPLTRFEQFDGENSTNVWRRLFLDVGTATGLTGLITGKVFSDYDRSTVKATFAMYQNVFQSKAEMGVVGKAVAVEFSHHSASLPFLINGYSWTKRNLRNV